VSISSFSASEKKGKNLEHLNKNFSPSSDDVVPFNQNETIKENIGDEETKSNSQFESFEKFAFRKIKLSPKNLRRCYSEIGDE